MRYGKDRREAKRISYLCEVEFEGAGLNRLATRINDLSMTGAFIDSMTCYAPGTVLSLRFRIKDILIETGAEVRYSMPQMGMGVRFLDLKPDHLAALESLIEDKPLVMPAPTLSNGNNNRREAKRISYVCEVECEGAGLNRLVTRINDLSITGAFIDSTRYAPGTVLVLRFRIKNITIETSAEVRYNIAQKGVGVRFLDLKPDHLAALESLIEGKPLALPPTTSEPHEVSEHKPTISKTPDMLLGNFAVVSMFDVIQIIENNRLGGALGVMSPAANGEIQFNDGNIVAAYSGSKTGIEALKDFLDVTEGSFEFKRSATHYPSTIHAPSNMSLMLDLLRVIDEEAAALS